MFKFILESANKLNLGGYKLPFIRTFLALSTLFTLLSTKLENLMNPLALAPASDTPLYLKISLFNIFGESPVLAKLISVGILGFVISGAYPRVSAILHWWVAFSFSISCVIVDGGDQINSLLCLFLIPILLLDGRKNQWFESEFRMQNEYLRIFVLFLYWVMRLQVSMIYFQAATAKLSVTEWTNGTAAYYWLGHPIHGMPLWLGPLLMPILVSAVGVALITWGTLVFEGILAMTLFMNENFRKYLFIPAVLFHSGIVLVHGLSSFFLVMTASLIILILPFEGKIRERKPELVYV